MRRFKSLVTTGVAFAALSSIGLYAETAAQAQDGGYQVGEKTQDKTIDAPRKDTAMPDNARRTEEKRLARIEYVSGKVTWRADDAAKWNKATTHLALREGAQIWAEEGGRAEVRFDDGSLLRLGNDAVATLQTFSSDDKGEYTRIKLLSGVATLVPKVEYSVYQIDTPFNSVTASGPGRIRIGVGNAVEVGVRSGRAVVEGGSAGRSTLYAGDFVATRAADTSYTVRNLPSEDSWERWNNDRDHIVNRDPVYVGRPAPVYVPAYPAYEPSFWFSLNFPFGGGYYRPHYYGYGRGAHGYRR